MQCNTCSDFGTICVGYFYFLFLNLLIDDEEVSRYRDLDWGELDTVWEWLTLEFRKIIHQREEGQLFVTWIVFLQNGRFQVFYLKKAETANTTLSEMCSFKIVLATFTLITSLTHKLFIFFKNIKICLRLFKAKLNTKEESIIFQKKYK